MIKNYRSLTPGWGLRILSWGLLFFMFFKHLAVKVYDPDLWWHISAGREMVKSGGLLKTDIFSHTLFGTSWINFEGLSQIFFYWAYLFMGLPGLFWAKMILGLTIIAILARLLLRHKVPWPFDLILTWGAFELMRPRILMRPELFTLLFFGLLVFTLAGFRAKEFKSTPLTLMGLFCGSVLWTNLHAGIIYGLGFVVLWRIGAFFGNEKKSYQSFLNKAAAAVGVGVLFNPFGWKLGLVYWEHLKLLSQAKGVIQEWGASPLGDLPLYGVWVIIVLGLAAAVIIRKEKAFFIWLPGVLVFSAWGFVSFRNTALFVFPSLLFVGLYLKEQLPKFRFTQKKINNFGFGVVLLILIINSHVLVRAWPDSYIKKSLLPIQAVEFIQKNNIKGTLFNSYEYGGYLHWTLGPEEKVFMDGRYLFHTFLVEQTHLNDDLLVNYFESGWPAYLDKFKVDLAIVSYPNFSVKADNQNLPFSMSPYNVMFRRNNWALIYWDDISLIFIKRTPKNSAVIDKFEFKNVWPYNLDQMKFLLNQKEILSENVKHDLERNRAQVGSTLMGRYMEELIKS